MKAKLWNYYKGKINYHRTDDLKSESLPNGTEVHLQASFICDEDQKFAGQIAFSLAESNKWLPECVLIITEQITFEEYFNAKKINPSHE